MSTSQLRLPPSLARYVPADEADALLAVLAAEIEGYVAEVATRAVHETLCANFGAEMGDAIFADLTGHANSPNTKLVPGVSRAAVSKAATRIRRGFGLPVRVPTNARPGFRGDAIELEDGATSAGFVEMNSPDVPATFRSRINDDKTIDAFSVARDTGVKPPCGGSRLRRKSGSRPRKRPHASGERWFVELVGEAGPRYQSKASAAKNVSITEILGVKQIRSDLFELRLVPQVCPGKQGD